MIRLRTLIERHPKRFRVGIRLGLVLVLGGLTALARAGSSPVHHFDIPAQPLAPALARFARQANITLLSSAGAVQGLRALAVRGDFTVTQALHHLLTGTGLSFRLVSGSAIAIVAEPRPLAPAAPLAPRPPHPTQHVLTPGATTVPPAWGLLHPQPQQLAQVLITATKRSTTLQTTAASVAAITAADIIRRGLTDFDSLARSVPGLAMRTGGPGQTEFEMRGLNSSGGNTSMVGLYLDEIPLSSPASAQLGKVVVDLSLYDLERVEVLRGPQGTLYGASSMGGTVRFVPTPPELDQVEASGESILSDTASGGGLNQGVNGMVNLPLSKQVAVRLVASARHDSGWVERRVIANGAVGVDAGTFPDVSRPANFYTAPLEERIDGVNATEVDSLRAELLWKPTANLSVLPLALYQLTRQGGPDNVDVNGAPTHPVMPAIAAHWEIYPTPEPQRDRFTLASLKVRYRLPAFTVTSATGYWNRDTLVSQDGTEETAASLNANYPTYDGPAGLGPTGPSLTGPGASERDYTRQLSQELRLTSAGQGAWQWLAGWFFQDLHSDWDLSVLAPQAATLLGGPNIYADLQPQTILQNAEFGELSWELSPHWQATFGLRHYRYALDQSNTEYGLFTVYGFEGNTVPYTTHAANGADGTVPKLDVKYTIDADHMVYATISKGFRLGGVNQPIPVAYATSDNAVLVGNECALQGKLLGAAGGCNPNLLLQAPTSFASDSVWSYELGEKSTLLDGRLTFDVSGYYERWLDPQLATNLAGFGITANGADARIVGLEAQLHALLGRDWRIRVNSGYTNADFTRGSAIIGYPAGTEVPDTPRFTASAELRWRHEVSATLAAFASLECDYMGPRTDAPYGETITLWNIRQYLVHLPGYSLGYLRMGLESGRWRAALFIDNLWNERALLDPQPQIDLQTAAFTRYTVNQPLTAGFDVTWRFR